MLLVKLKLCAFAVIFAVLILAVGQILTVTVNAVNNFLNKYKR